MKKVVIILILLVLISGCAEKQAVEEKTGEQVQIANPASVYCEEQGNKLEIRTAADGGQAGYCILKEGTECEEWAYFRGECTEEQPGSTKFVQGLETDYSHEYPVSEANIAGFEKKKIGSCFTAYYHPGDETNANKALAVLEQPGVALYKEYLGYEPKNIPAYLAVSVKEYVQIADFPGGESNVEIGAGSAPGGKIYLYKPFEEAIPERVEGMIVHEGVHAAVYNFLGQDKMGRLPGFLNEGLAHYIEYVFKAGSEFEPLDQIYHSDLLIQGSKTGNPQLLSLEGLAQKCEGYIAEENLNFLCRGQGSYVIWYLNKAYGKKTIGEFLKDLKQTTDWKKSLSNVTGKTVTQLNQEIWDDLKLTVEKFTGG